ncbi:TIGR01777 family oxidoreductase [Dokdonia ponticola]|uniref:TIGR01777 family oxidoreductase n=1 Tax=Dokdonia ponticola TaxID=2041041 RepID=A0ABV9I238_9FLAO
MSKLIIAGGTGFLGTVITSYFKDAFDEIVLLSRKQKKLENHCRTVIWDGKTIGPWTSELDDAEVLINMAGKSVDCRYHSKNKALILNSRIDSTKVLGEAIGLCKKPPKVWLNSSTATIYRHSLDKEMDEETGEIGTGFSVSVAKAWEKAFFGSETPHTRKVALRTAIVLGKDGGALQPMINITKLGLGGKQGSGHQKFSWIHKDDFVQIIDFCIKNDTLSGAINVVSPHPSDNKTVMQLLRKTLNIPFGIPSNKTLLEIGAFLINTETELLLKSRNVIPKRLLKQGYTFTHDDLEMALKELVS